jgi:hypothetical protein
MSMVQDSTGTTAYSKSVKISDARQIPNILSIFLNNIE